MKIAVSLLFGVILFLAFSLPVSAQFQSLKDSGCLYNKQVYDPLPGGGLINDPTSVATLNCIPVIVKNIIYWLLVFSGVVAVFIIIISGIKLLTSGGDPKRVEGARKTLTWAIIGLILILLSFAIVAIIADITGVGCIKLFGFDQCL